jgi:LacI family transcriptional regulator
LYSSEFLGIEVDSYAGVTELMHYLTGLGHQRIAYIGGCPGLKINLDRLSAYQAGLACSGVAVDDTLAQEGDLTLTGGYEATERLLDLPSPPTAIVCINDLTAIGAMHAVSNRGLVVGRDISVAGFDGLSDSAHSQPPLTTVEQPVYGVARQLVRILLAEINGDESIEKHVRIQPKLIIRSSTGACICER